jgi:hypothetical protein
MSGNNKHFVSILLVAILIMPTVIKLEHHHDHYCNHEEDKKSTTFFTEKCLICDFQFSTFTRGEYIPITISFNYTELHLIRYVTSYYLNNPKYSFLLRAPPVLQLA